MPALLEGIPNPRRGKAPQREVWQVTAPDPRVGEIEARLVAATPGPWKTVRYDLSLYVEAESGELNPINLGYVGNRPENDAAFIAHAPADVAYLLAELRKAHEALERVETLAERWESLPALRKGKAAAELRAAIAAANGDGR